MLGSFDLVSSREEIWPDRNKQFNMKTVHKWFGFAQQKGCSLAPGFQSARVYQLMVDYHFNRNLTIQIIVHVFYEPTLTCKLSVDKSDLTALSHSQDYTN